MSQPQTTTEITGRIAALREKAQQLRTALEASFVGNREVVDLLLYTLLAEGHPLLEGAPGLGKTTLVKGLARALDLGFQRIQFTPDLMPADILGARILEETPEGGHSFRFEPGPIFSNLVLADEINRATPRTQSALLEAMQEQQVTIFGESRELPSPFCVVATQNPIEMEGTYPLPEAQLDRFLCKIEIPQPSKSELVEILSRTTGVERNAPESVLNKGDIQEMRALVREVPASSDRIEEVARLIRATDPLDPSSPADIRGLLRFGASPRGGQAVLMLAKARALLSGRAWVTDEDVTKIAAPALRHRLIFSYEGEASGVPADDLIGQALRAARG